MTCPGYLSPPCMQDRRAARKAASEEAQLFNRILPQTYLGLSSMQEFISATNLGLL